MANKKNGKRSDCVISIFTILLSLLLSCSHKTGNETDFGKAMWIGTGEEIPGSDEAFYLDNPAPLFRKEFIVDKEIHSATLSITAAGYYRASMNGNRIGNHYLDPAWTDYGKTIYYSEFDLTADLQHGYNCLGITLGNGFYNPLPLKMWGHRNIRESLPTGVPVFVAILRINYNNGQTEEIKSDDTWKFSSGPTIRNSVYLGEWYDAREEVDGWDTIGYDDKNWKQAVIAKGPGGRLQKAFFPPIRITDRIEPVSVMPVFDNAYIVDMGVNFTGLYRIRISGVQGDTILFRFGERLYDNGELNPMTTVAGQIKRAGMGGPGAPDIAWQTDTYIVGDNNETWYSPEFTFHTYRYMEISGLRQQPQLADVEGLALNTDVKRNNLFSCSSDLVNSIQEAVQRTFLSNLVGVQSDCPAREKFGYGGDINASSEAYIYNFDMQTFYRKTVYDWIDAMNDTVFVDTAPFVGIKYCGLSWESVFLTTQYYLYLYYNDVEIIKELYELDLEWMGKVARIHPDGLVEDGLSDHESLEPVPVDLTGTSHYLQCAEIMATFASFMGDKTNEEKFKALASDLRSKVLDRFWNSPVSGPINRQTLYATLLYHHIIPENEEQAAVDSLLMAVKSAPAGHFTTGIFGTKYILETLSRYGYGSLVYKIVNSTDFPGWGYMIKHGATTIWETWNESDNVYSNCHPMFGSVSEWLFRWLGGIQPDPGYPGFEKFNIQPILPEGLTEVHCNYFTSRGEIVSHWRKFGKEKQVYEITVPNNSVAAVTLSVADWQNVTIFQHNGDKSSNPSGNAGDRQMFELEAGRYLITVQSVN